MRIGSGQHLSRPCFHLPLYLAAQGVHHGLGVLSWRCWAGRARASHRLISYESVEEQGYRHLNQLAAVQRCTPCQRFPEGKHERSEVLCQEMGSQVAGPQKVTRRRVRSQHERAVMISLALDLPGSRAAMLVQPKVSAHSYTTQSPQPHLVSGHLPPLQARGRFLTPT